MPGARTPSWTATAVRGLLGVGIPLTASTLVSIARYRLFAVLIGASAGATVLGQVHIAFRLVDTVRELAFTALWRLMLPRFSEHQHDRRAMLAQVDHWLRWCAAAVFPLCLMLGIGLTQIVALVMGPHWAATGQAAIPLVALMAWSAVTFPSGVALIAVGEARFTLYANLASLVLSAAGVLLLRPTSPWQAVMIWTVSQMWSAPTRCGSTQGRCGSASCVRSPAVSSSAPRRDTAALHRTRPRRIRNASPRPSRRLHARGTSRAVMFHQRDLPERSQWDPIFLAAMAAPTPTAAN